MCLMAPGRVSAVEGATATVDVEGRCRLVSILVEPDVRVGDWVVVAGGVVLRRIDASTASDMRIAVGLASSAPPSQEHNARGARGE